MFFSSFFNAIGILCVLVLLLICWRGFFNVFLHPLKRFPGPLFARAYSFHFVYHKINGTLPFNIKKLHDEYGSVVRVSPNELSYNCSEAWQDICGHRVGNKISSFGKDSRFYGPHPGSGRAPAITAANDEDHRRMRRLQSHAFSEKALAAQEPVLKQYVDLLIDRLHRTCKDPRDQGVVDLVKWYNFTTFDIIGDLAFGRSFHCLKNGETHFWVTSIFKSIKLGNLMQSLRYINRNFGVYLFRLIPARYKQRRGRQFAFVKEMAKERISAGVKRADGRDDFMSYILRANDEKGMSRKEIEEAASIFIVAGSETTASLLSGLTYHLLKNPKVYQKLKEEIRSAFRAESEINFLTLNRLAYMHAVLEEALRIYPPTPSTLPRVVPDGGEFVVGEFIPGGITVGVNMWSAFHSDKNFYMPDEFIPERWLSDERFANENKKVFQPWSFGPRNCIGRNLAYAEMRLILGRVLWNFDMELMSESENWQENQRAYVLWDKGVLKVKLTPVVRA